MPGPLRCGFVDTLISLHLESYAGIGIIGLIGLTAGIPAGDCCVICAYVCVCDCLLTIAK